MKNTSKLITTYFLITILSHLGIAQLANTPWPMFQHDERHTGRSQYEGPNTPYLKWKLNTSTNQIGHSFPVIGYNGDMYNYIYEGYGYGYQTLYVSDKFGNHLWYGKSSSPVAIGIDSILYMGSWYYLGNNHKPCFAAYSLNGELKWRADIPEFPELISPVISSYGTIYTAIEPAHGFIYSFDPLGLLNWQFHFFVSGFEGNPSPAIDSHGTIYSSDGFRVYAINQDGTIKWVTSIDQGTGVSGAAVMIGDDGTIYAHHYHLFAIDNNGNIKWTYPYLGQYIFTTPALGYDGTIYMGADYPSRIVAINPDSTLKWEFIFKRDIHSSPVVDKNGIIYLAVSDTTFAFYPNGQLKWKIYTGTGYLTSAAIGDDGTLYVGPVAIGDSVEHEGNINIHHNPAFSQYTDLYFFSNLKLNENPQMTVTLNGIQRQAQLTEIKNQMYKGSYQIDNSGTGQIKVNAKSIFDLDTTFIRDISFTFLKSSVGGTIISHDKKLNIQINNNSMQKDSYFSLIEQRKSFELNTEYSIAPTMNLESELTVEFDYQNIIDIPEENIAIFIQNGEDWIELPSIVDIQKKKVYAQSNSTGSFKLGFGANSKSTSSFPQSIILHPNFPNPFNSFTTFEIELFKSNNITISIFDILGKRVKSVESGYFNPGKYRFTWNGKNDFHQPVSSGVYLINVQGLEESKIQKIILLK